MAVRQLKERDILKQITKHLSNLHLLWWRNNTGAVKGEYNGKKRFVRFGRKGSPDIFIVREVYSINHGAHPVPMTQVIGIEVKRADGEQSQMQHEFEVEFTKAGGRYCLARSLEDVVRFLNG